MEEGAVRQGVEDCRTCMDHCCRRKPGYAVGDKGGGKSLRGDGCACCCGSGSRCHQDTCEGRENESGHVHCFQNIGDIILEGGSFDDARNRTCTDQKDGYADNFAEAEFHVFDAVFDLAGCQHAHETADGEGDQGIDRDACDGAEGQHDDHDNGTQDSGTEAGKILLAGALNVGRGDCVAALFAQQGGEEDRHNKREDGGNEISHHDSCQILLKCFGNSDRVGVGGNDVSGLAAADHSDEDTALGEICSFADRKGDGSNRDDRDIDEYADCADDHGRDRDRRDGSFFTELFDDGLGDLLRRASLDQRAGQNTAGQDPQDRGHHRSGAAYHSAYCCRESASADQAADQRAEDQAVCGLYFSDDQNNCNNETDYSSYCCELCFHDLFLSVKTRISG